MDEEKALSTIKDILNARGIEAEDFEPVAGALDETKMYTFAQVLIIFSTKSRVTERELNNFIGFASENNHTGGILIVSPSKPLRNGFKSIAKPRSRAHEPAGPDLRAAPPSV